MKAGIIGASGYAGGEVLRLLLSHPEIEETRAFSESAGGKAWAEVHPALLHSKKGFFEPLDHEEAARWADALFLCLPHGKSQGIMEDILEKAKGIVIDLAADFRIHDLSLYEAFYGPHSAPGLVDSFVYGLADIKMEAIKGAKRIASPGCFATAALLGTYPFAREGVLACDPVVFAITGSSGSGAQPRMKTHHPIRANNFFGYSLAGHRHEAEAAEQLRHFTGRRETSLRILTHSAPVVRGIYACCHMRLERPVDSPNEILEKAYDGRPFVWILDKPPELSPVIGTNYAHIHGVARENGMEVVVEVAIDNLVKGAAGQAVQSMNIALGLPETLGLENGGIYPC